MDDMCCILRKGDVDGLLHSLHPIIKFIMEMEEGGSLPFLDAKITRRMVNLTSLNTINRCTRTDTCTLGLNILNK